MSNIQSKTYSVILEEDPITNELILPFPQQLISDLNWEINDTLSFEANTDGIGFIIKNLSLDKRNQISN